MFKTAAIYLLKVNNGEIYPKLTIKTPERCQWSRAVIFIVNTEQISYIQSSN